MYVHLLNHRLFIMLGPLGIPTPRLNRLASIFILTEQAHKETVLRQRYHQKTVS